ncbi:MAG: metallophosphoesterase [Pseudomonadota bacterium]
MMSNNLVIAQVTDLHIGPSDISYRGIKVREQFLDVLQVLANKELDLLVLSGDLAAIEGEPEAYAWLRQVLTTFPYPYIVMAGNHDHAVRMKRAFDLADSDMSRGMLYFSRTIKGKRLLFLDSSSYRIPKQQLEWLSTQLADSRERVLLFIHHPPLLCDCQFMDECHALQNIDDVLQVLDQSPQIQHIFCGHYHADKTVEKNGKSFHLTPSTVFQIDTENPEFAIEHTKPGWRIIEWENRQVQTYVEYL